MKVDVPKERTVTVVQGTPEWAFLAALRALRKLREASGRPAFVKLYADGSGELHMPSRVRGVNMKVVADLTGSRRLERSSKGEVVVAQCQGFAYRDNLD